MKPKNILFGVSLLALMTVPAYAASLAVNGAAAIEGSFGLEVDFSDATTQSAFVVDTTPANETVYRAEFKITLTDLFDFETALPQATPALRQRAHHLLFMMKDLDQAAGGARQHASVHLKKVDEGGGTLRYKIWARTYAPTSGQAAGDGYVYRDTGGEALEVNLPTHISGYPVTVRVEWTQASTPGGSDGILSLTRDNAFDPGNFTGKANTTLPNGDKDIDQVELGAVGGVDDGTSGSYYVDSFASYRTLSTP